MGVGVFVGVDVGVNVNVAVGVGTGVDVGALVRLSIWEGVEGDDASGVDVAEALQAVREAQIMIAKSVAKIGRAVI